MTHIDTAEMYGSGAAETLVGEAIAGRRDEVFLVSKVLPNNASRNGTIAACERSLKRLETDRLDCYLLHWRGSHPLGDTVAAFERLRADGKILSWGVSNFDVDDLDELSRGRRSGQARLQSGALSLAGARDRACRDAVVRRERRRRRRLQPVRPRGGFPEPRSAGGRVLKAIADRHRATPRQVALRFLTRRDVAVRDPQGFKPGACGRECGRRRASHRRRRTWLKSTQHSRLGPRPRSLPML